MISIAITFSIASLQINAENLMSKQMAITFVKGVIIFEI